MMLHRTRDLLMRQRTQVINALRAHLAELGTTSAQGREGLKELLKIVASDADERLPADAHASLVVLAAELQAMQTLIGLIEKRIVTQHRENKASKRLRTAPVSASSARLLSRTPSRTRKHSGRGVTLRLGLGSCRVRIRRAASRNSGRSRNRAIAICDAFSLSARTLSCGAQS